MAGHALLLWRSADRIAPEAAGDVVELKDIYTHPDCRRRGVGHALIRAAEHEARARGIGRLGLGVVPDNRPAIRLYGLTGFEPLDHPPFETHEAFVDEDGTRHEWRETVIYLVKDLP
jgi:GNAT superfamily N-acetyltransferase